MSVFRIIVHNAVVHASLANHIRQLFVILLFDACLASTDVSCESDVRINFELTCVL